MKSLITGASGGIGRGIARVLGRSGFPVGLLARSTEKLETLRSEIESSGGRAVVVTCDLRDPTATQDAISQVIEELDGLDVLINNAGVVTRKSIFDISNEEWREMVETNIDGVFHATRAVLPIMKAQGSGHVVNVSSISGRLPLPGGSAYAATKYAVTGFSESLFHEVRDHGIKVTTVFPGSVDSESHRHADDEDQSWKVTPEEVGEACKNLLQTSPQNLISRLEIRPLRKPKA